MVQESLRKKKHRAMQEGHFFTLTSERKAALQKGFRGTSFPGTCEILLREHCF